DDTTRYLCAAAQLSSDFSNAAISEYLVEPTRPVPPSPGFDVAVVLNEAVAARARRIVRDTVLLIVAVLLLVIAPPIPLLLWGMAAGALVWMFSSGRRPPLRTRILAGRTGGWQAVLSGLVSLGLLAILAVRVERSLVDTSGNSGNSYDSYGYPIPPADHSVQYGLAGLFMLTILAVLAADRAAVRSAL